MVSGIEIKNVSIITGNGDFVDGAAVLAALRRGVVEFVVGDEADDSEGIDATRIARRKLAIRQNTERERAALRRNNEV